MAKIYLNVLAKKYDIDPKNVRGIDYRLLMTDVIANQSENLAKATARISKNNYAKQIAELKKRVKPEEEKKIILPDISSVIPQRSVFVRKAAEDGNLITDTLRDKLTKNLRDSLNDFRTKSGEQSFVRRRGEKAGSINPKVISIFENKIKSTFESYTKKDPRLGIPDNVHQIAVTEIRSVINKIKHEYNKSLDDSNSNIRMMKIWRQNKSLSKNPRENHGFINGKKIEINDYFEVPRYKKKKGVKVLVGVDKMLHPHDPMANVDNVIGCNCDIEYVAVLV